MQWSLRFEPEARRRSASGGRMQWSLRFEPEARKKKAGGEARLGEREPPDRCGTTITKSGERPGRAREGAFGHHGCAGWRWPLASFQDAVKVERRCSGVRWFPLAALVSPPAHVSRASGSEENFSLRILDFEFRVSSFEFRTQNLRFRFPPVKVDHLPPSFMLRGSTHPPASVVPRTVKAAPWITAASSPANAPAFSFLRSSWARKVSLTTRRRLVN